MLLLDTGILKLCHHNDCNKYIPFPLVTISFVFQIVENDIHAHQPSVESVNDAGKEVISSEGGAEARDTRRKLDLLNQRWDEVLGKARDRHIELDDALRDVSFILRFFSLHLPDINHVCLFFCKKTQALGPLAPPYRSCAKHNFFI